MKNIQNKLLILLFIAFAFPHAGFSQDSLAFELSYEVHRINPPLSISRDKLKEAQTLAELNGQYKPSWVKEYISVEVLTRYQGNIKKVVGRNDTLSQEQKEIMNIADVGTDISVKVNYIPDNNFTHNDIKEVNFTFSVHPESEAEYPGGQQQLKQYIKVNAIDKISEGIFIKHSLTVIKFTINEEGQVSKVHVFETSKDEKTDELLMETISNMPDWKPAEYSNGTKVNQEFALTVGDKESCVINLVNIHHD